MKVSTTTTTAVFILGFIGMLIAGAWASHNLRVVETTRVECVRKVEHGWLFKTIECEEAEVKQHITIERR